MNDPYLDPVSGVLANKLNITNLQELNDFEFSATSLRDAEITQFPRPGGFNLKHLCSIHAYLFQDVFFWAGLIRTVSLSKENLLFCQPQYINSESEAVFALISDNDYFRNLVKTDAVSCFAQLLGELNALHPFRDGNGRTQRAFLRQLAATAGWRLDWTQLDEQENIEASIASMNKNYEPFEKILESRVTLIN